jgi:transcriptional regulator with XRE-family HTH domain
MKLSELRTQQEVLADQLRDPEFRAEWERLTPARVVASCLLNYRGKHRLSQRALAEQLGLKQPAVARLEAAEHEPDFRTLRLLSGKLGIEFLLSFSPMAHPRVLLPKKPARARVFEEAEMERDGSRVTVVAG